MKKSVFRERYEVTEPEIIDNLEVVEEEPVTVVIEESPKKKKTTKKKGSK